MTSSLVGSEMCIRDRSMSPSPFQAMYICLVAPVCCRLHRLGRVARVSPVSYTHLTLPTICSV
eukprot:10463781-Prorocentrum_lima.AAC.1